MKIYIHSHQKGDTAKNGPLGQNELVKAVKNQGMSDVLSSEQHSVKLDKADIFLVEVSSPSIQAGYVIAYAINVRKPILCLYSASVNKKDVDYLVDGVSSKLIRLEAYNKDNIDTVLHSFLRQKRKKEIVTTKFTLRVPPSVVEYLNWKQLYSHKSKAALIRDGFIEEVVRKDENYQTHLREK